MTANHPMRSKWPLHCKQPLSLLVSLRPVARLTSVIQSQWLRHVRTQHFLHLVYFSTSFDSHNNLTWSWVPIRKSAVAAVVELAPFYETWRFIARFITATTTAHRWSLPSLGDKKKPTVLSSTGTWLPSPTVSTHVAFTRQSPAVLITSGTSVQIFQFSGIKVPNFIAPHYEPSSTRVNIISFQDRTLVVWQMRRFQFPLSGLYINLIPWKWRQ